ncbi:rhodanese-like domain-containing protein [Variovorax sp. J31P207]|uniref:rhodanese-like domain-containing protein n=1 Tax=Variovorax sp. J31P207 TaxID=3053510 RepID=UPI0025760339|nr:rhodanese-like domain-containing protein [Variovorax sp. J31P207]MDM0066433.1 rhodanese-like domain-containing protein [Variovorax sp. J31P207]
MPASSSSSSIAVQALHALLLGDHELALLDVREARAFVSGHLNLARLAPLSSLGLEVQALVPRLGTQVVLVDTGDPQGPAPRAAKLLARLGYTDVRVLAGGTVGWQAAGLPLIDGYATLVKAFGGQVLARHATPTLPGAALRALREAGRSATLIDARPADEYAFLSLPGSHNHAGTELALRQWPSDGQPGPWLVHCFSRTRGIIGSTTLRLLGHSDAHFLEDGVMQWALDGAPVRSDARPAADLPVAPDDELRRRADALIGRHRLPLLRPDALSRWRAESDRTLYLFDLRPGAEAAPDIRSVAGGQLLMHFENLVGTRGARIVLLDDPHHLRAAITAFWLRQLNQSEVWILDGEPPAAGAASAASTATAAAFDAIVAAAGAGLAADEVAALLASEPTRVRVVDVGPSADFEGRHLPAAHFLLPSTLTPLAPLLQAGLRIVFASPDGHAARWVAAQARERWPERRFDWLRGGTAAWQAAGWPIAQSWESAQLLTSFEDDWGSVMRVSALHRDRAWADYLAWECGLSERVAQDPTVRFRLF